jgi:cystathionine beta-lyase
MKFNTKTILAGNITTQLQELLCHRFSNFTFATSPGNLLVIMDSRTANPTRTALEEALASIENGARGLVHPD